MTTLTRREFNEDTARAKKAAAEGPAVITDPGQPAHVLMTYERFEEPTGKRPDIVSLLGMPQETDIDFEPAKVRSLTKPPALDGCS